MDDVAHWKRFLDGFEPSEERDHDLVALQAVRLAVDALEAGTYGIGAVLLDETGEVLIEGHNRVHIDGFRSDLHAEMVVLNEYEALGRPRRQARDYTLVTSLESCPMCMTRLIVAGVGTVLHVAEDPVGGMVQRRSHLPPIFRTITAHQEQVWAPADCSLDLRVAAFRIWIESRDKVNARPD